MQSLEYCEQFLVETNRHEYTEVAGARPDGVIEFRQCD
jgi:hypothetical protein